MNNNSKPLQLALYGMDERSCKTMVMYLKGPCKAIGIVADEFAADIDMIDADHIKAKELLDQRMLKTPNRPIILLSLEPVSIDGTIYVKKPVQSEHLVAALKQAKALLTSTKNDSQQDYQPSSASASDNPVENTQVEKKPAASKHIDKQEIKKTSKHRTAMDLTEVRFSSYLGHLDGIDFSDPEQVLSASFNPKSFYLGYVQSAVKVSKDKARILQLNAGWKPLVLFPHTQEVWLDVDDKQLRAFAGIALKSNPGQALSLTAVDAKKLNCDNKMESFYDMDHFLWKLAVWTSKGRYPEAININEPLYLKHWPNFTRLLVTPHAMRIAALMVMEPRTGISIADALKIKPQYVFVFISAAHAIGLIGQAKRQVDELITPTKVVKDSKSKGLLSRILGRLRG